MWSRPRSLFSCQETTWPCAAHCPWVGSCPFYTTHLPVDKSPDECEIRWKMAFQIHLGAFSPTVNLMSCSPSGRAAWAVQSQGNIYRFNEDFRVLIPRASHHFPPTAFLLHAVYIYVQPKNLDGMHSHVLLSGRKGTVFISVGRCLVCRVPISSNVIVTWYFYDFYALQIMFSEVLVFLREYVCGIYK